MGARPELFSPDLLREIRGKFHHTDFCPIVKAPRVFFENGGGSLKLKEAVAANAEIEALPDQEGRKNPASAYLSEILDAGREDLHLLFGSSALGDGRGQVLSGETGTRLLYRLIRSIALAAPPGPVLSSTLEHPASLDSAKQWAKNTNRAWIEVPFDPISGTVSAANYAAAVTPDTRLATVIHTSMLTGFTVDLAAVSKAIRAVAPDCYIIVDGIQHAPHGTMDVATYGADAYVFSPYKAFSRLSLGFAWINDRIHQVPHEHMLGKSSEDWELGSRDPAFYAAESKVVDYYCWLGSHFTNDTDRSAAMRAGTGAMERHEAALIDLLINGDAKTEGLRAFDDVKIIGPLTLEGREGIVSFNLDGMSSPDLVQEFAKRGIRVHARVSDGYSGHILGALGVEDCLRVSMCHYNAPDEVRQFLAALKEIRASR
ncbi:MAG: aminotransferase class V-fold PLP-dependent enzyme [Proteobacteria bacterium]|nr:aminotransferase class V-fold PLP-dependent enzyme [Pseudomonadota bacterium]MDA1057380.1 aminotransferase class V-fold PLP-dependent enzyme [Pseudomonadota bacterium]